MIDVKPNTSHRGFRIEDKKWNKLLKIASQEKSRTGKNVTVSDVVRHAVDQFLETVEA